eukprot:5822102-Amphidinium_carterae.1
MTQGTAAAIPGFPHTGAGASSPLECTHKGIQCAVCSSPSTAECWAAICRAPMASWWARRRAQLLLGRDMLTTTCITHGCACASV